MPRIYLAFGTNLGERPANLRAVQAALPPAVTLRRISPIYETEPWGITDQPRFLNQVAEGETQLAPGDLLLYLKDLERRLGRTEGERYGPRVIDIDILSYGRRVVNLPDLQIPHPRLAERAFVLVPLADLNPGWKHPASGKTVIELLAGLDTSGVRLWKGS
jgi:2-amino-4-hydroxy-6-hydroxymethyldihydropteridine diphosphokinase